MRYALPGSVLVHAGILGIALYGFAWPEAEDAPAASAVTVDIISMTSVDTNATEVIESDATVSQTSAGSVPASEPLTPVEPETVTTESALLEPLETEVLDGVAASPTPATESTRVEPITAQPVTEPLEPVEPVEAVQPTETVTAEPVEPVEQITELASTVESDVQVQAVTPVQPTTVEPTQPVVPAPAQPIAPAQPETVQPVQPAPPVEVAAVQPVQSQPIEAVTSEDLKVAPVPQMLSFERTSKPTYPDRPPTPKPQTQPKPQQAAAQPKPQPQATPPSAAGNGGSNEADSAASATGGPQGNAGAGGQAEADRYSGQVRRKVERARPRSSGGLSGEVVVQFTVSAGGQMSGLRVARSSGNAAVDEAGLAMVNRAAPFAPIPPETGQSSMSFSLPLYFER